MHPHMSELTLIAAGDDFCITLHPNPQLQVEEKWRGGVVRSSKSENQRLLSGVAWLLFSRDLRRRLPVVCLQEDAGKPAKGGPRWNKPAGHRHLHMAALHATEMVPKWWAWILRDWVLRINREGQPLASARLRRVTRKPTRAPHRDRSETTGPDRSNRLED